MGAHLVLTLPLVAALAVVLGLVCLILLLVLWGRLITLQDAWHRCGHV